MADLAAFFAELRAAGLRIRLLAGDELELTGPRTARSLTERIREHKADLIDLLRGNPNAFGQANARFLGGSENGSVTGFRDAPELNVRAAERAAFRRFIQGD